MSELFDISGKLIKQETNRTNTASRNGSISADSRFWLTDSEMRLLSNGQTPVEYLFDVMRDNFIGHDERMKAAALLLPYVQSKAPTAIYLSAQGDATQGSMSREASAVKDKLIALIGI